MIKKLLLNCSIISLFTIQTSLCMQTSNKDIEKQENNLNSKLDDYLIQKIFENCPIKELFKTRQLNKDCLKRSNEIISKKILNTLIYLLSNDESEALKIITEALYNSAKKNFTLSKKFWPL